MKNEAANTPIAFEEIVMVLTKVSMWLCLRDEKHLCKSLILIHYVAHYKKFHMYKLWSNNPNYDRDVPQGPTAPPINSAWRKMVFLKIYHCICVSEGFPFWRANGEVCHLWIFLAQTVMAKMSLFVNNQ